MTVSAHEPFREMAVDVAGKYAELSGGTPAVVGALRAALTGKLGELSAGAPDGATIDLGFHVNGSGLEVTLACGAETAVVRQPLVTTQE